VTTKNRNGSTRSSTKGRVILKSAKTGRITRAEAKAAVEHAMAQRGDRIVYLRVDGKWASKRSDSSKASSLHDTRGGAVRAARATLKKQGGGELTVLGRDGRIRSKDTVATAAS
jgi:hypothetical protein